MNNRILIVDTIATNRIMLKVKLTRTQYQIDQAESAIEALALLKENQYKLVIASVDLPDTRTSSFCRALRAQISGYKIPIILFATDPTSIDMEQLLTAGVDEIFAAPIDANLLVARVRSLIRAYDELAELQLREGTQRALGFAETAPSFENQTTVAFVGSKSAFMAHSARHAKDRKTKLCHINPHILFDRLDRDNDISAFIVDVSGNAETAFDVLTELRSRKRTWRSVRLARVARGEHELATRALDLGAHEVFDGQASDFEIGLRLARQLRHKSKVSRLRETMKSGVHAAMIDPLTGVFNRRYALSHLHSTAQQALRTKSEFSVMMIDIDHFKKINDHYGHQIGDQVLKEFSTRLIENIRAVDLLARIGGEEFLVILPDCKRGDARYAAERLRLKIQQSTFSDNNAPRGVQITASIGIAMGNSAKSMISPDEFLDRADKALYDAKIAGRDQISICNRSVA